MFDLQEHFERYCNVLPAFGKNSAKYDVFWSSPIFSRFLYMIELLN